jgi:hypothetical protein
MLDSLPSFDNIDFKGGNLSSDGGSILLLHFLRKMNIADKFRNIPFDDNRFLPVYSNSEIMAQLTARTLLGYFGQADQKILMEDPLLSKYFHACSQPTVSRFFDRVTNQTNVVFREQLIEMACKFINQNVSDPIIDADSTLLETYGNQEASSYIHHYSETGYHPLLINEFHSKLLLSALLRTGSSYSSNGIVEELHTVLAYMYNRGTIRFRGDSAFYNTDLMQFLEDEAVTYYIRTKGFETLTSEAMDDMIAHDIKWQEYTPFHPYYGEFQYSVAHSKPRRILYKAYSVMQNGQITFFPVVYAVITNDQKCSPKEGMHFYELRGASENFTKELKNDFDGARVSHRDFWKNEMDFLISAYAYNLFHIFQNRILEGTDQSITMNTFRLLFQKIAVKVIRHAGKLSLRFSTAYTRQPQFMHYWNLVLQL